MQLRANPASKRRRAQSYFVRARSDVELLHLSPEGLAQFRKTQKDGFGFLVMNIARLLSVRLREANRH